MKYLVISFLLVSCLYSKAQSDSEFLRHRLEGSFTVVVGGQYLYSMRDYLQDNGFGADIYNDPNWLSPDGSVTVYPRVNTRRRFGYSLMYGYSLNQQISCGMLFTYSSLGNVTGNTDNSKLATFYFSQYTLSPTIMYHPTHYVEFYSGFGISFNKITVDNSNNWGGSKIGLTGRLGIDFVIRYSEHSYFKIGMGYQMAPNYAVDEYSNGGNTLPSKRLDFNYYYIRCTLLGVSF